MDSPRVWTDKSGDPWIEVEPGRVVCVGSWLRQAVKDKVGLVLVDDVQEQYGLRLLVPCDVLRPPGTARQRGAVAGQVQ
jgi:hypothetical protein